MATQTTPNPNGWNALPCGALVRLNGGRPVRVSDGGTDAAAGEQARAYGVADAQIAAEIEALTGYSVDVGEWQGAEGEADATAAVRLN